MKTTDEFIPTGDRVLVRGKHEPGDTKTTGGIIIPEQYKDKSQEGEVMAVGKKVEILKVGDKVFIPKYSGTEIVLNRISHYIFHELEVLGVIDSEEEKAAA